MPAEERIEGELLRFSFKAEGGGFAVAHLKTAAGVELVAVGSLGHITEGQHVQLTGWWIQHSRFGRQLKVTRSLIEDPRTLRGLELYLGSGAVAGMGPTIAKRVVAHFGLQTLAILESDPSRLREVPGIGPKRLARILAARAQDTTSREVHAQLRGYGVGAALTRRIIEAYGEEALAVVARQPYRLAAEISGVGFHTADRIAVAHGLSLDSPERAAAALVHVLREAGGQGHCFVPRGELLQRVAALKVPAEPAQAQLHALATRGDLVIYDTDPPDRSPIYLPRMDVAESRIARRMARLLTSAPPPLAVDLDAAQGALHLSDDQQTAIRRALEEGVCIITGGPGTGKTTIVRALLAAAGLHGESWLLAAPTGRAARRLTEATDHKATTIHRLLEFNGRTRRFTRGFTDPLDADGVLIDEASMLDVRLMDDLLAAIPPACRLVLVGDVDQLPSVGPGRVLADLIDSGAVPVARLHQVYRQAAQSGIIVNAHRVNAGRPPVSGERDQPPRADFFTIDRRQPLAAQQAVLQIVSQRLPRRGFDPLADVQVLTPMHSGPLGTIALNTALQALLNPDGAAIKRGEQELRQGDRVLQIRNDYDNEIFNGDVGRVVAVGGGGVVVDFEGQQVPVTGEKLDALRLAYAISIHKSQGSEYPAVVVVLHAAHRIMLRRNLLYTALTRAARFCCLVGTADAIDRAVRRPGGSERWTGLAQRMISAG